METPFFGKESKLFSQDGVQRVLMPPAPYAALRTRVRRAGARRFAGVFPAAAPGAAPLRGAFGVVAGLAAGVTAALAARATPAPLGAPTPPGLLAAGAAFGGGGGVSVAVGRAESCALRLLWEPRSSASHRASLPHLAESGSKFHASWSRPSDASGAHAVLSGSAAGGLPWKLRGRDPTAAVRDGLAKFLTGVWAGGRRSDLAAARSFLRVLRRIYCSPARQPSDPKQLRAVDWVFCEGATVLVAQFLALNGLMPFRFDEFKELLFSATLRGERGKRLSVRKGYTLKVQFNGLMKTLNDFLGGRGSAAGGGAGGGGAAAGSSVGASRAGASRAGASRTTDELPAGDFDDDDDVEFADDFADNPASDFPDFVPDASDVAGAVADFGPSFPSGDDDALVTARARVARAQRLGLGFDARPTATSVWHRVLSVAVGFVDTRLGEFLGLLDSVAPPVDRADEARMQQDRNKILDGVEAFVRAASTHLGGLRGPRAVYVVTFFFRTFGNPAECSFSALQRNRRVFRQFYEAVIAGDALPYAPWHPRFAEVARAVGGGPAAEGAEAGPVFPALAFLPPAPPPLPVTRDTGAGSSRANSGVSRARSGAF